MPDDLKQSKDLAPYYLAAIVESAEDPIISKTLHGIIISWNQAAERVYGYPADEVIGKPMTLLIPSDRPDEEEGILERIRHGERIEHFETVRVRKGGERIHVSLTLSPIRDGDSNIVGVSHIARDITARKASEHERLRALEEARKAREQAEFSNRLKDEFLATLSHELRTPLTAVLGWIRLLRAGGLDAQSTEKALEVIDRNVRSQAQLIEDLLDISRVTMGKFRLDVRPIELAAVITSAVDSLRLAADARQVRIQTVLDSHAGPVSGDFERLQQVVWNLLSNAIKFTPKQGRVQVVLERVNSHIEIRISDTGKGIRPDFLPYVFDPFSQGDAVTTRSHGGLGLGLAITRAIVELHGGTIVAQSEGEGKGSTFTVNIPVMPVSRQISAERLHPKTSWKEISVECPPEVAGLKILVIDDDPDTCDMLRVVLEQCGGIVETANSAGSGFDAFRTWQPAIVISDIGMPEIDGYEFIRRIREYERPLGQKIPAIALTAFARIEDRVRSLAAGYQMHVAKPIEPGELLTIVASLAGFIDRR